MENVGQEKGILEKAVNALTPDSDPEKTVNPNTGNSNASAIKERIAKRGRPSEADKERNKAEADAAKLKAEAMEKLYTAKQWAPIASLYFDTRFVMTGYDPFLLNKEQKDELGTSLALIMREMAIIDPKWVALTVFSVQMTSLIIQKELAWKREKSAKS